MSDDLLFPLPGPSRDSLLNCLLPQGVLPGCPSPHTAPVPHHYFPSWNLPLLNLDVHASVHGLAPSPSATQEGRDSFSLVLRLSPYQEWRLMTQENIKNRRILYNCFQTLFC